MLRVRHLEESASHPLPHQEGVPQVCKSEMVICRYLWILVFVWALVSSGLRYYQSASIECNGATQKIHMREI